VIASLVVIRIVFQFLLQGGAALLPRHRAARREPGRFRMPLYPLPIFFALAGFLYILFSREEFWSELRIAGIAAASGAVVFTIRTLRGRGRPT